MEQRIFTCVYLVNGERGLLLAKKTKKLCVGLWNGYGGKVKDGEHIDEAAVREFAEETRKRKEDPGVIIDPSQMEKVAIGYIRNTEPDGSAFLAVVHFYFARKWEGEVEESDEMITPMWFSFDNLPFDDMAANDREWLPYVLAGKKIVFRAHVSSVQRVLLAPVEIEFVEVFPN